MAREQKNETGKNGRIKRTALGSAAGIILFFVLLCAAAAVLLKTGMPAAKYRFAGAACAGAAGLIAGFGAVIPVRKNGFATGVLTGLFAAVPSTLVLFCTADNFSFPVCLVPGGVMIASAALGGIAAANIKRKNKY